MKRHVPNSYGFDPDLEPVDFDDIEDLLAGDENVDLEEFEAQRRERLAEANEW
jgi:hypothetical protein